jgi:dTDP-4-dehydrorhamnose reductase
VKILLTGKNGQIGWELCRALAPLGEIAAYGRAELDLATPDRIVAAVRSTMPDVVVNAAAYTAVDQAEREPDAAHTINAVAVGVLAEEAKRAGAPLIHYSTDYVFDGTKEAPYVEEDVPNPLNEYGRSKLAGEQAIRETGGPHLILRTSWVYSARGRNFFLTMKRLLREKQGGGVISDLGGAPTCAAAIADATAAILGKRDRQASGVYHLTASGSTSWHGFATEIARLECSATRVVPIPSEAYPSPARRPRNSRLSNEKLLRQFGFTLPSWEDGLKAVVEAAPR